MIFPHALRALVLLASILSMAPATAAEELKGTWSILKSDAPGKVRFGLAHRLHGSQSQHESDWPVSAFQGLDPSMMSADGRRDVTFAIQRDAGRFDCEGYLKNGEGAGIYRFTPDAQYAQRLHTLGFTGIDRDKQFAMAVHDVSVEFARAIKAEKLDSLDTDKLIAFRIFDVTPAFIHELRVEGLAATDADRLVAFRVHGVTPAMVRDLRASDLTVSEHMLIAFQVHGVSAEFIDQVEKLGFGKPDAEQLVAMRVHGVTPEFITDMRSRGLKNLTIEQLINLRVHGID
jgi:hypothetical protein